MSKPKLEVKIEATCKGKGPIDVTVTATPAEFVENVYAIAIDARACRPSCDKYRRGRYRLARHPKDPKTWKGYIPNPGYPFFVLGEAEFSVAEENSAETRILKRDTVEVKLPKPSKATKTHHVLIEDPPPCNVMTGEDGTPWLWVRVTAIPPDNVVPDVMAIATSLNPPPEPDQPLTQDPDDPKIWQGWIPHPGVHSFKVSAKAEFLEDAQTSIIRKHIIDVTCP